MSTDSFVTLSKVLELFVVCPHAKIKTWKYLRPKYKRICDTCCIKCCPHLIGKHPPACHSIDCRQSKAKDANSSLSRHILSETFCTIIFYNLKAFVYLIISPFRSVLQMLSNFYYSWESKTFESLIFALFIESLLSFALEISAQWDLTGCAKTYYSIWSWIILVYLIKKCFT